MVAPALRERLPVRLEPAPAAVVRGHTEGLAERFAASSPRLDRRGHRQRLSRRIVQRRARVGVAEQARVGRVRAHRPAVLIDHQHGVSDAGQNHRELRPLARQRRGQLLLAQTGDEQPFVDIPHVRGQFVHPQVGHEELLVGGA